MNTALMPKGKTTMRNLLVLLVSVVFVGCATAESESGEAIYFVEMESGTCGTCGPVSAPEDFCADYAGVAYATETDTEFQLGCVAGPALNIVHATGHGFAFIGRGDCQSSYEIEQGVL